MKKKISLDDRIFIAGSNGMAGKAIYKSLKIAGYGSLNQNGEIFTDFFDLCLDKLGVMYQLLPVVF